MPALSSGEDKIDDKKIQKTRTSRQEQEDKDKQTRTSRQGQADKHKRTRPRADRTWQAHAPDSAINATL
jgi:hypothetical protein